MLGGDEKPRPRRAGLKSHANLAEALPSTQLTSTLLHATPAREKWGAGTVAQKRGAPAEAGTSVLGKEGSLAFRSKAIRGLGGGSYSGEHRHKSHESVAAGQQSLLLQFALLRC